MGNSNSTYEQGVLIRPTTLKVNYGLLIYVSLQTNQDSFIQLTSFKPFAKFYSLVTTMPTLRVTFFRHFYNLRFN